MRVINRNYSTFYDIQTGTSFAAVLDRQSGCYVAMAEVSDAAAAEFAQRTGFEVLDDAAFLAMQTRQAPTIATGDPLTDVGTALSINMAALDDLPYADLQQIARDRGIKPNQAKAVLIEALRTGKTPGETGAPPPPPSLGE